MDIGNLVSDGHTAFITKSKSFLNDNSKIFGIDEEMAAKRIKAATDLDVVYLPEVPRIPGHADLYLAYVGKGRYVVSAARNADQRQALDDVAEILGKHGIVERVLNSGWNNSASDVLLTYAQVIIVDNKIIIPGYAEEANYWLQNHDVGDLENKNGDRQKEIQTLRADDRAAAEAYRKMGFEVIQIQMRKVPELKGGIHCLFRSLPTDVVELLPAKVSGLWLGQSRRNVPASIGH